MKTIKLTQANTQTDRQAHTQTNTHTHTHTLTQDSRLIDRWSEEKELRPSEAS